MRFIVVIITIFTLFSCEKVNVEPESQLPENVEGLESLATSTNDNTLKLKVYAELFKLLRSSNAEKALVYLSLQETLAKEVEDNYYLGKALFGQGYIYKNLGNYVRAVDKYVLAIDALEKGNEVGLIGSTLNNLGGIFAETGNYEYAEKFYTRARNIHVGNNDIKRQVLANLNLAICNFSKRHPDFSTSEKYFAEGIDLTEQLIDSKEEYLNWIYTTIGAMKFKKGEYDAAKASYLKSIEYITPSADSKELQFIAYTNISEAAMGAGIYEEAHEWMDKAMMLDGEQIAGPILIGSYNIRGQLYQAQQNHASAIDILEQAIDIADKSVINEPLQESLLLIRESYRQLNESGKGVSRARYDQILALDAQQDDLEKQMAENTNFQALQAALNMTIELDNEIKAKQAEKELKILYIALAIVILLLGVVVALFLMYRARQIEKEYASYRSNLTDTMREGFQRLVNWKGKEENIKWLKERGW